MKNIDKFIYAEDYNNFSIGQVPIMPISISSKQKNYNSPSSLTLSENGSVKNNYEVTKEVELSSVIPPNSRMMAQSRTFKNGEVLEAIDMCKRRDGGYIELVDGATYRFSCGRNSALKLISKEVAVSDEQVKDSIKEEVSFLSKYKTPLIAIGVIAAVGIGYYFINKK
jgi:hypothetical protein